MTGWKMDKRWSDKFIQEIKGILGQHLISEPPIEEDAERNTDLMVLRLDAVRIGCRVRKFQYLAQYGDEFTIRAGRPSGTKTELTKIIEGWGDYFFYGFSNENETTLEKWFIGDLKALRLYLSRQLLVGKGIMPGTSKTNTDNSSSFIALRQSDIPSFVIAHSENNHIVA